MLGWLRRMLAAAPRAGEWAVTAATETGRPIIMRTRTRAPQGMTIERYPASVEIVWRFDGSAHGGMPTPELNTRMTACEDALGTLESPENGLLGLTITGNGRREWVWYVANADEFSTRAQQLLATEGGRFPVELRTTGPAP